MRPGWARITSGITSQPCRSSTVCVHGIDLVVTVSISCERNLCPIRRPGRGNITSGVDSQPSLPTTIRVHDIDLREDGAAVSSPCERNLGSIRRPSRAHITSNVNSQSCYSGTVHIHGIDLIVAVSVTNKRNLSIGHSLSNKDRPNSVAVSND